MPQVDLESLVCGGGGGDAAKVSCETLATGSAAASTAAEDPNLPAESFQLRIGDEIGWTDINAVYDRDDSTKGNTNPKSQQHHGGHSKPPKSISQRFSGNLAPKAPIIGLPNKIQHSGYLGSSRRLPKGRVFPKGRRGGGGTGRKAAVPPEAEPGSPKVSFFGKVLSEPERCRRQRDESGGCWAGIMALLRCRGGCRAAAAADEPVERKSVVSPVVYTAAARTEEAAAADAAPGLGAMKQFASRRRTASWGGDAEESGTLDGEVWARRSVGSLEDYRGRDW